MGIQLNLEHHPSLTKNQRRALTSKSEHLLLTGFAGTGKTYIAMARGFNKLKAGEVDKIIVIRSAVAVRDIGFLPGDEHEKSDVYAAPYMEMIKSLCPKSNFRTLEQKKVLEFTLTSYLRGLTFDDAFVILDEFQNCSAHELETVITRVGQNTQLCIVGDDDQSDLKAWEAEDHVRVIEGQTR